MSAAPKPQQTLDMARDIANTVTALAAKYPDATGIESLWIAFLALYDTQGVAFIQALSVNKVSKRDL